MLIKRIIFICGSLALPAALGLGPVAQATCGSANCFLVTGTQEGVSASGILTVDVSYRFISQSRRLAGMRDVSEVLTPKIDFENGVIIPDHHREVRTQNTLVEIDLSYGLTPRLTLAASLPVVNQRDHEHWDDVGDPDEHFTREDGSSGFGDVRVGARYALLVKTKDILTGSLVIKLPTGAYTLHDGEGAINEPTIQPGTGTTDVILSAIYAHQVVPARLEWFLSAAWRPGRKNDLEYEFGDETLVNAGFWHKGGERVTWSLQVNWRQTGHDRFLSEEVSSTGVTFVDLTPGLRLETSTGASLYAFVQVPVQQDVNEVQLAPRTALLLGVSKSF